VNFQIKIKLKNDITYLFSIGYEKYFIK